jgi:multidrug efflux system outer membrane protein
MKFLLKNIAVSLALAFFLSGCKSIDLAPLGGPLKPMPQDFGAAQDSTQSAAEISWKTYFADPLLVGLIDTALANNLDLAATLQRIEAAHAQVLAAQGMREPLTNAGATTSLRRFGFYTMDGAGNATTDITPGKLVPVHLPDLFIGVQSVWEADVWGKLKNQKKAAVSRYLASLEGRNLLTTLLVNEVAVNYYELLGLDENLKILRQAIQLQQTALDIVKIQKQAGAANELAVKQFEAQLLNSQGQEAEILQLILEAENRINFLLGRFPQPILRNSQTMEIPVPTIVQAGIPSSLLQNRPDIRAAELELLATRSDLNAAKAAFYPSVNIGAAVGFQAFSPEFLFSPKSIAYNLLGGVAAPLVNKKGIQAAFNTAKASQLEAYFNYQQTILNAYAELSNELSQIKTLAQTHDLKAREAAALVSAIDIAAELYRSGRADYLEVLFAQQSLLQASLERNELKTRQLQSLANVYKLLGGGWR